MFSLVATLAFGSFAMANNVDVETVEAVSVENVVNKNSLSEELQLALTCQEAGQQIYRKYRGTFGHSAAIAMANAAVDACIAAAQQ